MYGSKAKNKKTLKSCYTFYTIGLNILTYRCLSRVARRILLHFATRCYTPHYTSFGLAICLTRYFIPPFERFETICLLFISALKVRSCAFVIGLWMVGCIRS